MKIENHFLREAQSSKNLIQNPPSRITYGPYWVPDDVVNQIVKCRNRFYKIEGYIVDEVFRNNSNRCLASDLWHKDVVKLKNVLLRFGNVRTGSDKKPVKVLYPYVAKSLWAVLDDFQLAARLFPNKIFDDDLQRGKMAVKFAAAGDSLDFLLQHLGHQSLRDWYGKLS